MPQAVGNIVLTLQELTQQLRGLEHRVAALEATSPAIRPAATERSRPPEVSGAGPSSTEAPPASNDPYVTKAASSRPATFGGFPPTDLPAGTVPILGKAVLGIAGAYLLRALTESSSIPKLPILLLAIFYAVGWMAIAVRTHAVNRFASTTYSVTSALILAPLLWESTVRFQTLSATFTATVLAAYVVVAIGLSWRGNLQVIPWLATLASVATALALIIATHDLVPLTCALLAIALATEAAAGLGRNRSLRAIPAFAADLAVIILVFILAADNIPEGYRAASSATITALCLCLLAIYSGSIGVRCFLKRETITIFDVAQAMLAFGVASYGALRATHDAIAPALGILFLLFAVVCYWGAFSRFLGDSHTRNRRVSATWAGALLLAGSFLLFSATLQIPFLCLASAAAVLVYVRTRRFSLPLHASFCLAAAAAVSPLLVYAAGALAGQVPGAPDWRALLVVATAGLCYAAGSRVTEAQPKRHLVWTVPAAIVGFATAAVTVVAIVSEAGAPPLSRFSRQGGVFDFAALSVVRTIVNCALALALGFLGSRAQRIELRWVAYAAVAFGTLKLLFEDLRFGNAASLVVSLLFYGLVLILLPRFARRSQNGQP